MNNICAPEITDHLALSLRAFAETVDQKPPRKPSKKKPPFPSEWALIFDTETTVDAGQALRFGAYQLRQSGLLMKHGVFFDPDGVTDAELHALQRYATLHGLSYLTRDEFIDEIFFGTAYQCRAAIVGFNLPFDISRLAIRHGSARSNEYQNMRGGFTFTLSKQKIYPNVQVKHKSRNCAFIRFAAPMGQRDARSERGRGHYNKPKPGHFVDVKTLANALFARGFSLSALSNFLKIENPKLDFENFAAPINDQIIEYALRDVQATWECYCELEKRLDALGLPNLPAEKVYSEASIGKANLKAMGITPWRKSQADFPAQMIANILSAYFGGRSEVRIRRELREVMMCDFLSMYPTVCTLMRLWRFVIADGMTMRDATDDAKAILETADLDWLQKPHSWQQMAMLVRVKAAVDIFPVRACYAGNKQSTIGLNYLSSGDSGLWFTLADCIASKLLVGKAPRVIEAVAFQPGAIQPNLQAINVSGKPDYRVDPANDDLFKRVIELRQTVKEKRAKASGDEFAALDTEQNALKILANATSYGIYVEVNVAKRKDALPLKVHNVASEAFEFLTDKAEETGAYFHPLLATLITGAARLMLAIAERQVLDSNLEWSFCDTDSIAIAKPDQMDAAIFAAKVDDIVRWFEALNPYDFAGSILKIEDENLSLKSRQPEPLYCWAVSAKRYALFNLGKDSMPIMRKVSAHGLGHLLAPFGESNAPTDMRKPDQSVLGKGIAYWHVDLWWRIVKAAISGNPDCLPLDYHPAMQQPAISRYSATSPELLRWFKHYNAPRSYRDQVKPFGFLLAMSVAPFSAGEKIVEAKHRKGRRKKLVKPQPVAAFDSDLQRASAHAFCRESGQRVLPDSLKSYADALASYHLHPEDKFLNGYYCDQGTTRRRHVQLSSIRHIGKEANDWEAQAVLGYDPNAAPDYGLSKNDRLKLAANIDAYAKQAGISRTSLDLNIPKSLLQKADHRVLANFLNLATQAKLDAALSNQKNGRQKRHQQIDRISAIVTRFGLRKTARRLKTDPSNLKRKIAKFLRSNLE